MSLGWNFSSTALPDSVIYSNISGMCTPSFCRLGRGVFSSHIVAVDRLCVTCAFSCSLFSRGNVKAYTLLKFRQFRVTKRSLLGESEPVNRYLLVRLVEVEDVIVAEAEAVSCPELCISNFFVLYTDLLKFGLELDRDFALYEVSPLESVWAFHLGD